MLNPLRERRHRFGWTQAQLASRCGLALRTVSGIERGEVKPLMNTRRKLALVLGMSWPMRVDHKKFFGPMPVHGPKVDNEQEKA